MDIKNLKLSEIQEKYNCNKSMALKLRSIYKDKTSKNDIYSGREYYKNIVNKGKHTIFPINDAITADLESSKAFDELLDIYGDELKNTK